MPSMCTKMIKNRNSRDIFWPFLTAKTSTDQEGRLPHCPTVLSVVHAPLVANVRGQARRRHLADQGKPGAGRYAPTAPGTYETSGKAN